MSTKKLIEEHLSALQRGDLNAVLADYSDDAILIFSGGIIEGKEALSGLFNQFLSEIIPADKTQWNVGVVTVARDIGYVKWTAVSDTHKIDFASDTFIIADGKIVAQTSVGEMSVK
ncbi:MAG: ketosteroid isomerase-like protein [Shewanella sp.]|jgi:ketosteroid isomerase-like protein